MKRIATTLLIAGLAASPLLVLPPPATAAISIGIAVNLAPPPLPVYEQPMIPAPGYIWTPGYWAWDPGYGYYWVPGTWVMPPQVGLLWTPGWWGWSNGAYRWNAGYWGRTVGFYGGIDYGYGYFGTGYVGGEWRGRQFYYNRAVNNVNVTNIHNVYVNKVVVNNTHVTRVSYNGGRGGLTARPSAAQRNVTHRVPATSMQVRQREVAMQNPAQRFKANQGRPAVFATQRAGDLKGPHAVRTEASARGPATRAPQHASAPTAAPNNHRMVEAPHNRTQAAPTANRARGPVEAPRNRMQSTANAQPRMVQAPHEQRTRAEAARPTAAPRPEVGRARPVANHPQERPQQRAEPQRMTREGQPPQERRPEPTRASQAHAQQKRNEKHPPKSSGGQG